MGDWVGVIAIAGFAYDLGGNTAVGAAMTARVLPGFIVGPVAGVLVDRWDRKRTMVVADVIRAGVIFSVPFVPNLWYLFLASAVLESLTLVWGPAKDASLPNFVPTHQLAHANSLALIAVYGPWPLASLVFAGLSTLGVFLGDTVPVLEGLQGQDEAMALWLDSLTFIFSAVMISTLVIRTSTRRAGRLDFGEAKRDLVEGLTFVRDHKQVRPWLIGIAFTFTAAGGVFSLGVGFTDQVLGAGDRGFSFIVGFLAVGMIVGLLSVAWMSRRVQKDVLFSAALLLLGVSLIALASMSSLNSALPIASALGFFGGVAYSTGYSLMHETTRDDLRGRTFSAAYTVIRIGTLVGLAVFPFVAGAFGDVTIGSIEIPGSRLTFWLGGLVVIGGGFLSMRAIQARSSLPSGEPSREGFFVVFEGGEGAGKTTQMEALAEWFSARGEDVVTTREPGGTPLGSRIRDILLDPGSDALTDRTEALLYAADRAQHVEAVIRPALDAGKVVISDRYLDSSLAYQGLARGLGLERIYGISEWATGGLLPDLVFYMRLDPKEGLQRVDRDRDRLELESDDFHSRVNDAYAELARRFADRFVILDAAASPEEVHEQVIEALRERAEAGTAPLSIIGALGSPASALPR